MIDVRVVDSPIGPLSLAVRGARLCLLHFGADEAAVLSALRRWYPAEPCGAGTACTPVAERLASYFSGATTAIDGIDVELNGTLFQRRVWDALRGVGAGATASYRDIAERIGAPGAVRAVGAANGANPVAIVVPCHRIIGSSGSLTGYGGGLERKQWLLRHESAPGLF